MRLCVCVHLHQGWGVKSKFRPKETQSWILACVCVCICVFHYLQKGVHSPLFQSQNEVSVQGNETLLSASSRSWTLEAWEPEDVSFWQDSGSSNRHNGTLRNGDRKRESLDQRLCHFINYDWSLWCPKLIFFRTVLLITCSGVFMFLPRYSNSSFRAMPLWEKHCWQIRAYL